MSKYVIKYWMERNDEPTDIEVVIEADDQVEAMRKFLDSKPIYRKIESIAFLC
jgi:uncharacterized protein YajQ (UPF0234 family)